LLNRLFHRYATPAKLAEIFEVKVETVERWLDIADELRRSNNDDAK